MVDASFSMAEDYQKQFKKDEANYYVEIYHQTEPDYCAEGWEGEEEFEQYEEADKLYETLRQKGQAVRMIREEKGLIPRWEVLKEDWPD